MGHMPRVPIPDSFSRLLVSGTEVVRTDLNRDQSIRYSALCAVSAVGARNAHCPRRRGGPVVRFSRYEKESPLQDEWTQLSRSHLSCKALSQSPYGNRIISQSYPHWLVNLCINSLCGLIFRPRSIIRQRGAFVK